MIAWTSPLPMLRSIPLRISISGWATGATRKRRMTSRCSSGFVPLVLPLVLVTTKSGSLEGGGGLDGRIELDDSLWDEVGEGHRVERAGDGITDAEPQDVDRAARAAIAGIGVVG